MLTIATGEWNAEKQSILYPIARLASLNERQIAIEWAFESMYSLKGKIGRRLAFPKAKELPGASPALRCRGAVPQHRCHMTSVLIISIPRDPHARAVEWALKFTGNSVRVVMYSDFPQQISYSESIDSNGTSISIRALHYGKAGIEIDSLWRRRVGKPLVSQDLHPADVLIAEKESNTVIQGFDDYLDKKALMSANSYASHVRSRHKTIQLRAASKVGLFIPNTLISNCPDDIKYFSRNFSGNVVIKSFTSPTWMSDGSTYFTFTKKISEDLLKNHESLSAAPAIYQEQVEKAYEVRILFMGAQYFAVKLNSQESKASRSDWRRNGTANLSIEPWQVPDDVIDLCKSLMAELGLITGSFDFAVDHAGRYIFFEINEQGQFLWMEQRCPSMPILQVFSEFLASCDRDFYWDGTINSEINFINFEKSGAWRTALEDEKKSNIQYNYRPLYME